jgi:CrcB protein
VLAVATGGAIGSLLRWVTELALPQSGGLWATLLVNVVGSAALAVLVERGRGGARPPWLVPAVGTGLLGGFTTFSAYAVQVAALAGSGNGPARALTYAVVTAALCVAVAALAGAGARRTAGPR